MSSDIFFRNCLIVLLFSLFINGLYSKTIYVGPQENYKTISSALNAAVSGDLIVVKDGTYDEDISIQKPVTIRAENQHLAVIGDGIGNQGVIRIGKIGGVNGITVDGFKLNELNGLGFLVGYEENEQNYAATNVTIKNNLIQNRKHNIVIGDYTNGYNLTGNWIENSPKYGMTLRGKGVCIIDSNHIEDCRLGGIFVHPGFTGTATVRSNNIINNRGIGIDIQTNSANTMDGNLDNRIAVRESKIDIAIEGNNIISKNQQGIRIESGRTVSVEGNTICENKEHGILALGNVELRGNTINGNGWWHQDRDRPGIVIDGSAIVDSNTIKYNFGEGIRIGLGSSNVEIKNNIITANGTNGIKGEHSALISGNTIDSNGLEMDWLMAVDITGATQLKANKIRYNRGGIRVRMHSELPAELISNTIINNILHGVYVDGYARIDSNLIMGNSLDPGGNVYQAVFIRGKAELTQNIIRQNHAPGILITPEGNNIRIEDGNEISENLGSGIEIEGSAIVKDNKVFKNFGDGILVKGTGHNVQITDGNMISGNFANGITIEGAAEVSKNRIDSNIENGILIVEPAKSAKIFNNYSINYNKVGLLIDASAEMRGNFILHNQDQAIWIGPFASNVNLDSNVMRYNHTGVLISLGAKDIILTANEMCKNENGVVARSHSVFRKNQIDSNIRVGVRVFSEDVDLGQNSDESAGLNSIQGNTNWNVRNHTSDQIFAYLNNWGSNNPDSIDAKIKDDDEDSTLGPVLFSPFISETSTSIDFYEAKQDVIILTPYPNPFTDVLNVRIQLPYPLHVLKVHDLKGNMIRILETRTGNKTDLYQVAWNGKDAAGRLVPEGIYLLSLETPYGIRSIKVIFLR